MERSGTLPEPSGSFEGTDATWEYSTWISPAGKSVGNKCLILSKLRLCLWGILPRDKVLKC